MNEFSFDTEKLTEVLDELNNTIKRENTQVFF